MNTSAGKLVRDRIPEIIQANGDVPNTHVLNGSDYLLALINKLDEEVLEFKVDHSLEELADILEVVLALADVMSDRQQLEAVRSQKAKERGGFKNKIFLDVGKKR